LGNYLKGKCLEYVGPLKFW